MKKYIYPLILIVVLLSGAAFLVYKNTQKGASWTQYTNDKLGFSIEYPSNELTPTQEGSFGSNAVRIDNNDGGKTNTFGNTTKIIIVNIIPTEPAEVSSVDDWIRLAKSRPSPGEPFPNLKYTTVDGEKAATYEASPQNTDVIFFHDKKLRHIAIINFSPADTEHIWKSFKFLNK